MQITRRACVLALISLSVARAQAAPTQPIISLKEVRERGVVMQQWETSCAAAALATVLTYGHGDPVSEVHVVSWMLKDTNAAAVKKQGGFSLLDMKRFVENRGYTGRAYKHLAIKDLLAFHAPIVPIKPFGYNHYVVFNGMNDDEVFLADPAFGNRRMPLRQFERVWIDGIGFVVSHGEKRAATPR